MWQFKENIYKSRRDSGAGLYYYTASQFTCTECGFVSSGWVISSPTPLIGGKYYVGSGAVHVCGSQTSYSSSAIPVLSTAYNSCLDADCSTYYSYQFSTPGRSSSSLACAQVSFTLTLYAAVGILDIGVQMYLDYGLTTPVGSGNLWYQLGVDGISYRIDNSGQIAEIVDCSV